MCTDGKTRVIPFHMFPNLSEHKTPCAKMPGVDVFLTGILYATAMDAKNVFPP